MEQIKQWIKEQWEEDKKKVVVLGIMATLIIFGILFGIVGAVGG